jgi:hypothetical protein
MYWRISNKVVKRCWPSISSHFPSSLRFTTTGCRKYLLPALS